MDFKHNTKRIHLALILAFAIATIASVTFPSSPQVRAQTTPTNTATPTLNKTQGTIEFLAVSAATLIFAALAFAWILKRTKKPSQKRVLSKT